MSRPARWLLAAALALLAAPAAAEPPPAAALGTAEPAQERVLAPPPRATRVLAATGAVVLLVGLAAAALRWAALTSGARPRTPARAGLLGWLRRWSVPADRTGARIELVSRRALGPREALCLVRVGTARLLVGVTAAQISLLARLDEAEDTAAPLAPAPEPARGEPGPVEFAEELHRARREDEAALQELIARSRERLARLTPTPRAARSGR